MPNNIILKKSSVVDKVPLATDLQHGELALNFADGNLFYKNSANAIATIASNKFVSVTGNVTGGNIIGTLNGSGANVTSISATNISSGTLAAARLSGTYTITVSGSATTAGTVTTAAQPNITSVGTLSALAVTGNTTSGNFVGTLNGSGANVSSLNATNLTSGTVNAARLSGTYTITVSGAATTAGTVTTAAQPNITSVGTLTSLAVTGNTTSGNFVGTLNGSGANVSSINATNISSGTLAQARLANASLTVNGTAIALGGSGVITATATGTLTIGTGLGGTSYNGSTGVTITNTGVTSIVAGTNIAVSGATGAVTVSVTGTVPTATTAGTVTTAAQPNITSVGTLSSLAVTGNTTSGNFVGTLNGSGANVTTINATNISSGTLNAARLSGTYTITVSGSATTAGTVTTAAQPNITSVGTLTALAVTGNITSGNVSGTTGAFTNVSGSGAALSALNGSNVSTGTVAADRIAALDASKITTGTLAVLRGGTGVTTSTGSGNNVLSTSPVLTTPNLGTPSAGTLTSCTGLPIVAGTTGTLTVARGGTGVTTSTGTGAVVLGTSPTFTTQITVPAIVKSGTTGVGNIGAAGSAFDTVFAKATSAQYADLAENYSADAEYEPGTVLSFGGDQEVTINTEIADRKVAGVVSTQPAYLMNTGLTGHNVAALALMGRVPVKVVGPVAKGDFMVSGGNGHAIACATPSIGTVIGKAIQDFAGESGIIEVLINNQ
jgi:hypothetical protein